MVSELGRWRSAALDKHYTSKLQLKCLLLLQRTWVQFPAPRVGRLTTACKSNSTASDSICDVHRHPHTQAQTLRRQMVH